MGKLVYIIVIISCLNLIKISGVNYMSTNATTADGMQTEDTNDGRDASAIILYSVRDEQK